MQTKTETLLRVVSYASFPVSVDIFTADELESLLGDKLVYTYKLRRRKGLYVKLTPKGWLHVGR